MICGPQAGICWRFSNDYQKSEHMVRIRETFHQFPVYSDKDTSEREDRFSGVFCRYLGDYKLTMKPKQGIMSEGIKRKNKEIKETKRNEERYQCRNF